MTSSNSRPKWWLLYLTFPLLIALFALDHRLKTSTSEHEAIQIGIIVLVYGLIYWWLKANSRAISRMDQQKQYRVRVIQIPPLQLSEDDNARRSNFQVPHSEVKGLLSDTFEMDSLNSNALSIDDISQEADKE